MKFSFNRLASKSFTDFNKQYAERRDDMKINIVSLLSYAFIITAIILTILAIFIPKKKDHEYTHLDKLGFNLNIALSCVYVYLSGLGVTTIFFADNPVGLTERQINLLSSAIYIGVSMPIFSYFSIFISVVSRKRGKSKFGFCIQFLPIVIFVVMLIMLIVSTSK